MATVRVWSDINGNYQEVGDYSRIVDASGVSAKLQEKVGSVVKKVDSATEFVQQQMKGLQNDLGAVKQTLTQQLTQFENGLIKFAHTATGVDVGTEFAGMQFGAGMNIRVSPSSCFDMLKIIEAVVKLIENFDKLYDALDTASLPGLDLAGVAKIAIDASGGCVNILGGAQIEADAFASFGDLSFPTLP